jgi:hypothetical protein
MALSSTQSLTEIFLDVKSGRCMRLTTLPPSVSRISENFGASTSRNPKGLYSLYTDNFTSYYEHFPNHIYKLCNYR